MRGKGSESFKGARLDRALRSSEWLDIFPNTAVDHMPMINFDQSPIKVTTMLDGAGPKSIFHFQAAWTTHVNFDKVVSEVWNEDTSIMTNVNHLATAFTEWNRSTFGNIHARKRKLVARLKGIQKAMAVSWHNGLMKLNKKLGAELEEVLNQEELLWYQRSRENWIHTGDRNTKFYHISTKVRQKKKKGFILKDLAGREAEDYEESGKFLHYYFTNMFLCQDVDMNPQRLSGGFPSIEPHLWSKLNRPVTLEEVKTALFEMAPYKAPGLDGIPAGFYQKAWITVGGSISKLVADYFDNGELPVGMNDTFISLIPKVTHPESVTQFQLISLCNVSYKIITKTMVNRMKPVLERLVSREQSSFVLRRHITDNIVLYQEILHSFRINTTQQKHMVIKVDLEKLMIG